MDQNIKALDCPPLWGHLLNKCYTLVVLFWLFFFPRVFRLFLVEQKGEICLFFVGQCSLIGCIYLLFLNIFFFSPKLLLIQMETRVGEPTVVEVDSVSWWLELDELSAFARNTADPPLFRCVGRMAGSMKTTVRCTALPVWRGDGSMWFTAKTASSKVSLQLCTGSGARCNEFILINGVQELKNFV